MSNIHNRINKLEKIHAPEKYKYMCVITEGWTHGWDTPEEKAKGYKIQPFIKSAGGNGGDVFYLKTDQELIDFAKRPDVELTIIKVGHESKSTPV